MKKYLLATSILSFAVVLPALYVVFIGMNGDSSSKNQNKKYDYPIKPGTADWQKLNSRQEMIDKVQIPADILHSLSTRALVETVLDYPLLEDYIAYSNPPKSGPQNRFELLSQEFNGYKELINRKNGLLELKDIYLSTDLLSHEDIWKQINDPYCDCESINYINNIEYLLAQEYFLKQASVAELTLILSHAQTIMTKKLDSEDYGIAGANSTAFLISRILHTVNTTCTPLLLSKDIAYLIEKGEYVGIEGEKIFNSFTQCQINER